MFNHYAPLDPQKTDQGVLNRIEILRLNDFGAQFGFALSVLDVRSFFPSEEAERLTPEKPGMPLLTWPFLDFIESLDLSGQRLVELGAGSSTLWFGERFERVRSFETNASWHQAVSAVAGPKIEVTFVDRAVLEEAEIELRGEQWLLVDFAGKRTRFLHQLFAKVPPPDRPSAIVLDNADWYRRGAAILEEAGYREIPFYGFKSGQPWISCTSLFFDPARFRPSSKKPFFQPPFSRRMVNNWDSL